PVDPPRHRLTPPFLVTRLGDNRGVATGAPRTGHRRFGLTIRLGRRLCTTAGCRLSGPHIRILTARTAGAGYVHDHLVGRAVTDPARRIRAHLRATSLTGPEIGARHIHNATAPGPRRARRILGDTRIDRLG